MESQFPSNSMQDSSWTIPNLPSELITEIFSRLPVKSLLRYRSVSKYLLDLISSPEFIKSHLSLSTINMENSHRRLMVRLIRHNRYLRYDSNLQIPINKSYGLLHVLDSVNGLICLTSIVDGKRYIFLWNPSIRKYWKLPSFETGLIQVSEYCFGFIYDEFRDDYKVVVILFNYFRNFRSRQIEVKIYSLMNNSWKSVDHSCLPKRIFRHVSGKFVNGKVHWATSINIFSIDMSDEKCENIEKPSDGEGDFISELEVLCSNLSVLCYNWEKYVSIWVMKEYGIKESWTMTYKIYDIDNPYGNYQSYFILNKGEILARLARFFKIYNPKDDWFSPNIIDFVRDQEAAEIYVESLVSPFPSDGRTSDATKNRRKRLRSSSYSK